MRYASEASLPFYMLHQTVIVSIGFFIGDWNLSILVKYPLLILVAFTMIMALYELLIRRINGLRILFGMKPA